MPLKTLGPIGPRAVGERVKYWRILNKNAEIHTENIYKYFQLGKIKRI
jgi:hypothetical protein